MRKDIRKEQIRKRKNFFPTLLLTILLWVLAGGMIYLVEPDSFGAIPIFFILVFLALLFTASTIFANTRRGLITALGLTIFLFLRYLGVGNIINFLLIAGLGLTIEIYFSRR
jgi:uncharacterized membrane protein YbhN (UPF0104 family)